MDLIPVKFRSPPPKPPRRRHSDQLSTSSSETYPSNRKKISDEILCCSDNKHSTDSSFSCGSLPADWTPEFCLENKIENLPVFCEQKHSNKSLQTLSHDKYELKEYVLEKNKNDIVLNVIPPLAKNSKQVVIKKYDTPYLYLISNELLPLNNLSKHLHKFLHKNCHRRRNSDPLPVNFGCHQIRPLSSVLSIDNNKKSLCGTSENQCLLQEIKSLKEINNKLWEHLCCLQASVENFKNCSSEDLLMSIYNSLKAKDSAMEDRMRIVLQERDNAFSDLDKMVHVIAKSFDDTCSYSEDKQFDEEIQKLLTEVEVTSNPDKLLQQQRLLLSYLYRSKELKLEHMLHEMKLIAAERDTLKLKVQLLEEELEHLKSSNEIWNTDNKLWESSLLNTLCQVIHQRDVATKNYSSHSMEYFNGRSSVRKKSLDSEEISNCLQKLEGACVKKKIFSFSPNEIKKYSSVSAKSRFDEIKYLKEEILILNASLETERDKRNSAEEKCLRLERLVSVLQKKLNGQNVGIPV